jgi:two-component system, LuxR family, sensor kinase FixL
VRRDKSIFRSKSFVVIAGLCAIALIAVADRATARDVPLALLYLLPVVMMSTVLKRWQILLLGIFCTTVAELADAFPWTVAGGIPRDATYFFAYTAAGLYVYEVVSHRRTEQLHVLALETEMEARRGVEEQLQLVVANSSIAIITADEAGKILNANATAEQLFAGEQADGAQLLGSSLQHFLPSLARVRIRKEGWQQLRTMMQCQGLRAAREPFLADVWFSTYMSSSGGRLTAMIVDSSVETRDREEANLEQVLVGSRLAIGAMAHEIRNICAAVSVVQQNLRSAYPPGKSHEDLDALRQLVMALERIASVELSLMRRQASKLELERFLRELFIIIHPSLREAGISIEWHVGVRLPDVLADQQSLLQVFLNLVRNAETALAGTFDPRISLHAVEKDGGVEIVFSDNGPGVRHPEELFQPFRSGSDRAHGASGLGLYLSRAMMLSFHGDLRYQPADRGASFLIEMIAADGEA